MPKNSCAAPLPGAEGVAHHRESPTTCCWYTAGRVCSPHPSQFTFASVHCVRMHCRSVVTVPVVPLFESTDSPSLLARCLDHPRHCSCCDHAQGLGRSDSARQVPGQASLSDCCQRRATVGVRARPDLRVKPDGRRGHVREFSPLARAMQERRERRFQGKGHQGKGHQNANSESRALTLDGMMDDRCCRWGHRRPRPRSPCPSRAITRLSVVCGMTMCFDQQGE